MMVEWSAALSWSTSNKPVVIVLITAILAYPTGYWISLLLPPLLRRRGLSEREVSIWSVILFRAWSGIVLGVPTAVIGFTMLPRDPNRLGLNLQHAGVSMMVAVIAWIVIFAACWFSARGSGVMFAGYPEIAPPWTTRLTLLNTASWIVYLIPFEFFFRGFLLFTLASAYGGTAAVLIVTGLYSFTHLVRKPPEQIGTIPGGILFGVLALGTGSILGPVLIHCFLAPVTEIFALRFSINQRSLPHAQELAVGLPPP